MEEHDLNRVQNVVTFGSMPFWDSVAASHPMASFRFVFDRIYVFSDMQFHPQSIVIYHKNNSFLLYHPSLRL